MPFRVSGKNLDIGEALRERITARVAEALNHYFQGGGYSGHVTVSRDGFGFRTECTLHLPSNITLDADGMAPDAYASADQAATRIEKRLRRYKRRLKDHHDGRSASDAAAEAAPFAAASYVIAAPDADEQEGEEADGTFTPVIIAESTTQLRRLAVGEAVTELDFIGAPVLVFRHAGHGRINVVYRRSDGHIGWIDPPAVDGAEGGTGAKDGR